tara:strand:+ start:116 stop:379 length:264 start_codon:yes stop_codon:yes gene_type:complete
MKMKSYRFALKKKVDGKNFSFTDHMSLSDKDASWYITKSMNRVFGNDNLDVIRVSEDVSGIGRSFKQIYSKSKGWDGPNLCEVNPYA